MRGIRPVSYTHLHWRLSDYMIPILRKDEIEEGAEELLRAFCPNAATNRREHDPFVPVSYTHLDVYKRQSFS